MSLPYGTITGDPGDEKVTGTTKLHPFGTRMVIGGDRVFKYGGISSAGAVGAGKIVQAAVAIAGHDMDLAIATAGSVGDKSITVTTTATDAAKDLYADGYVYINDASGEGHMYKILGHAALDYSDSAALTLNLYDGDPIAEAITTGSGSLGGVFQNPYSNMVVSTAGAHGARTGVITGVCSAEMTASYYGWFQTWGPAAVLVSTTTLLVGNHVRTSDNVAGAVEPLDRDGTNENWEAIGVAAVEGGLDTKYGVVDLRISP
jgi:hypothetical protein